MSIFFLFFLFFYFFYSKLSTFLWQNVDNFKLLGTLHGTGQERENRQGKGEQTIVFIIHMLLDFAP